LIKSLSPAPSREPKRVYRTMIFLTGEQLDALERLQQREQARSNGRKVSLSEIARDRLTRGLRARP
jgi:translation elongation factor EF-4